MSNNIFDNIKNQMKPDENLVEATKQKMNAKKHISHFYLARYIAAVVCILLITASVFTILSLNGETQPVINDISNQEQYSSDPVSRDSVVSKSESDTSVLKNISYSSLKFPDSPEESSYSSGNTQTSTCVASFQENFLKDAVMVIKCTIIDSYNKTYEYRTHLDKFEKDGIANHKLESIVYELKVDDVLYTDSNVKAEDVIKIECATFMKLKVNRQYILPIRKSDETIIDPNEKDYIDGNIIKDSVYSILYQYGQQIEVTLDKQYIFPESWVSLINENTIDVESEEINKEDNRYLNGIIYMQLKLRSDSQFMDDLKNLILKYK